MSTVPRNYVSIFTKPSLTFPSSKHGTDCADAAAADDVAQRAISLMENASMAFWVPARAGEHHKKFDLRS